MAATEGSPSSLMCDLTILDSLTENSIGEMADSWNAFCVAAEALLGGDGDLLFAPDVALHLRNLYSHGLHSLIVEHFLCSLEDIFEKNGASKFWKHFDAYSNSAVLDMEDPSLIQDQQALLQDVLHKALEEISSEKQYQEKCLLMLVHALEMCSESKPEEKRYSDAERNNLFSKYQLAVSSVLMRRLEELSAMMATGCQYDNKLHVDDGMDLDCRAGEMDIDGTHLHRTILGNNKLIRNIGEVVRDLRNLGFTSLAEDAYASAIFLLLKAKVHELAGDEFRFSILESIKEWIQDIIMGRRITSETGSYDLQAVPLQFLHALFAYLGDSKSFGSPSSGLKSPLASHPSFRCYGTGIPSEGLVRWQLRLEYFAYETLQDLRIAKLFEIIVDYPDSSPAIEDLKQCLEYTGQHSKLVDSFIAALKYRLLTAGASTNDILHQYVSTIKALRTIDPAGVFLEAVGEPIREYLRGRKDTIKCIVTMLTDGAGGNPSGPGSTGDSLLEELNRDEENQENSSLDDDVNTDDKQAWINAQSWEPDPVEADPLKGGRYQRKVDILGMIVGIIGSKDQLVNEYRVMLAEKLLNKSDYDIDSEIRTLELLKGILAESIQESGDHTFTLVEALAESGKTGVNSGGCEELLAGDDDDGERSVASVEDQLRKEMTVYEKFITGMLTNFGSMALDRIHNTLKMFCIGDPPYDKSLQQLQSFLAGLVAEEKLELRDGMYLLKK
ncbi:hypothetical protein DH2020_026893 [Rehmannia glutinosa]|uniref:Anaphase-promoting complex subunit 2 C-terminal domain-containing protein n=1 Tax=Rehmannia glutinosa TaxID=99300 RepID=A0ABR0VVQ4_REHGL